MSLLTRRTMFAANEFSTGGGGGGLSPTTTDLDAWYEADAITGLSDGDGVSSWTDSQNSNDLSQGTSGDQPIYKTSIVNGLPVLRFVSNDTLATASSPAISLHANLTAFAVINITDTSSEKVLFHKGVNGSAGEALWTLAGSGETPRLDRPWVEAGVAASAATTGSFIILAVLVDGTGTGQVKHYQGGTSLGTDTLGTGTDVTAPLRVGGRQDGTLGFVGDLAEMLLYSSNLSTADLNQTGNYLADKYGLTWTDV